MKPFATPIPPGHARYSLFEVDLSLGVGVDQDLDVAAEKKGEEQRVHYRAWDVLQKISQGSA